VQEALGRSRAARLLDTARVALLLTALVLLWGRPVAWVHEPASWPLTRWLRAPHSSRVVGGDAVMVVPWFALCRRASAAVAGAVTGA